MDPDRAEGSLAALPPHKQAGVTRWLQSTRRLQSPLMPLTPRPGSEPCSAADLSVQADSAMGPSAGFLRLPKGHGDRRLGSVCLSGWFCFVCFILNTFIVCVCGGVGAERERQKTTFSGFSSSWQTPGPELRLSGFGRRPLYPLSPLIRPVLYFETSDATLAGLILCNPRWPQPLRYHLTLWLSFL